MVDGKGDVPPPKKNVDAIDEQDTTNVDSSIDSGRQVDQSEEEGALIDSFNDGPADEETPDFSDVLSFAPPENKNQPPKPEVKEEGGDENEKRDRKEAVEPKSDSQGPEKVEPDKEGKDASKDVIEVLKLKPEEQKRVVDTMRLHRLIIDTAKKDDFFYDHEPQNELAKFITPEEYKDIRKTLNIEADVDDGKVGDKVREKLGLPVGAPDYVVRARLSLDLDQRANIAKPIKDLEQVLGNKEYSLKISKEEYQKVRETLDLPEDMSDEKVALKLREKLGLDNDATDSSVRKLLGDRAKEAPRPDQLERIKKTLSIELEPKEGEDIREKLLKGFSKEEYKELKKVFELPENIDDTVVDEELRKALNLKPDTSDFVIRSMLSMGLENRVLATKPGEDSSTPDFEKELRLDVGVGLDIEDQRRLFFDRLKPDLAVRNGDDATKFEKLPEFGEQSQDAFADVKEYLSKHALPKINSDIRALDIKDIPGLELESTERNLGIVKSSEQFGQDLENGKYYLDIDTNKLEDVEKLDRTVKWVEKADKQLHPHRVEKRFEIMNKMMNEYVKEGRFPESWKYKEGMDKETWTSGVEQTMATYNRATEIINAIQHLNRSDTGFKSDALQNLPEGIKVEYDKHSMLTKVHFGDKMVNDIFSQSAENKPILDEIDNWSKKYEKTAKQGMKAWFNGQYAESEGEDGKKSRFWVAGFGEAAVDNGYVNTETGEFIYHAESRPEGKQWQSFNLMKFDMKIEKELDEYGKPTKYLVTPDVNFHFSPPLVPFADDVFNAKVYDPGSEGMAPQEYKPHEYVPVQVGPGQIELVQAKDLENWKSNKALKHYAGKAIVWSMDGAMIVTGATHLRAAGAAGRFAVKEAIKQGAKEGQKALTKAALRDLMTNTVKRQIRKGMWDIGLGASGFMLHGAGSHDIPLLRKAGELRSYYFVAHGSYSLLNLTRATEGMHGLIKGVSPRTGRALENIGRTSEASQAAYKGALGGHKTLATVDSIAHKTFWVSEKAFITEFAFDAHHMYEESKKHHRPWAMDQTKKALVKAALKDNSSIKEVIDSAPKQENVLELRLDKFKQSLGPIDKKTQETIDGIIDKVKELSGPEGSDSERQKYLQELMKYFRYSGSELTNIRQHKHQKHVDIQDRFDGERTNNDALIAKVRGFEPYSAKEYKDMAIKSRETSHPEVRRTAALAAAILMRQDDGTRPDVLATREVTLPAYEVKVPQPDGSRKSAPDIIRKPEMNQTQTLSLNEVQDLLINDLHNEPDLNRRIEKAAVLQDEGLVSREHYASLLFKKLESKNPGDADEQIRLIAEIGRTTNRIELDESIRNNRLDERQKYIAKGLTAGYSSAELKQRLANIVDTMDEGKVKSTAQFTLDYLNKKEIDQVDKERFNEVYLKQTAGISAEEYREQQLFDLKVEAPDSMAGWQRKIRAINNLMDEAIKNKDSILAGQVADSIKQTLKAPNMVVAEDLLSKLVPAGEDGENRLKQLDKLIPDRNIEKEILSEGVKLFFQRDRVDNPSSGLVSRQENAEARARLIGILTPFVKDTSEDTLKSVFQAYLGGVIDQTKIKNESTGEMVSKADPFVEVRQAAIKSLAAQKVADPKLINLIESSVNPELEPDGDVRAEAVRAVESLVLSTRERRERLGKYASTEKDQAVKELLSKYFVPSGHVSEAASIRAKQKSADSKTAHDGHVQKSSEIETWMKSNGFEQMLKMHDTVFEYFNPDDKRYHNYFGSHNWIAQWNKFIDYRNETGYMSGVSNSVGRRSLVGMEADSQLYAYLKFRKNVEKLGDTANKGSNSKSINLDPKDPRDKISERQAAIFALGNLIRGGSRMGEPFYKHFTNPKKFNTDTRTYGDSSPKYRNYTDSENRTRYESIHEKGYWTQRYNFNSEERKLGPFNKDPWEKMEVEIAEELRDLAKTTSEVKTLGREIVGILGFDGNRDSEIVNDKTREVLVEGLDIILSDPNRKAESKREILISIASLVKKMPEAYNEKSKGMIAMMKLLDKHGKNTFDKNSPGNVHIREALNSRMTTMSDSTPTDVKILAHEIYERQWQSVLNEADRRKVSEENAAQRFDRLPKDLSMYEVFTLKDKLSDDSESVDEIVHDGVERIIDATNGETIPSNDPRVKVLTELTAGKYHERIRMAASLALLNVEGDARKAGKNGLLDIAINGKIAAYRHDAIRAIERNEIEYKVDDQTISRAREQFIEDLSKSIAAVKGIDKVSEAFGKVDVASLSKKSNQELIQIARDFVEGSKKPENARNAFELKHTLHRFGASLTNFSTLQMRQANPDIKGATKNVKDGLLAFGVTEDDFKSIDKHVERDFSPFIENDFDKWSKGYYRGYKDLRQKILNEVSKTGIYEDINQQDKMKLLELQTHELPSILKGINNYAELSADRKNEGEIADQVRRTLSLTGLSGYLTAHAFSEGTAGRAESYEQISRTFDKLGDRGLRSGKIQYRNRYYRAAADFSDMAQAELKKQKEIEPDNRSIDKALIDNRSRYLDTQIDRLNKDSKDLAETDKKAWNYKYSLERFESLSNTIQKALDEFPDKNSYKHHMLQYQRHISARAHLDNSEVAKQNEKARASLMSAIGASATEHGIDSSQYNSAVSTMIRFSIGTGQTKIAEEFIDNGIKRADATGDGDLKITMLRQRINLLSKLERKDEVKDAVIDYRSALVQRNLDRSGGEVDIDTAKEMVLLRNASSHYVDDALKSGDYGRASKYFKQFVSMDMQAHDGKLSDIGSKYLPSRIKYATAKIVENLEKNDYSKLPDLLEIFVEGNKAINEGELSKDRLRDVFNIMLRSERYVDANYPQFRGFNKDGFEKTEKAMRVIQNTRQIYFEGLNKRLESEPDNAKVRAAHYETSEALRFNAQRLAQGYLETGEPGLAQEILEQNVKFMSDTAPASNGTAKALSDLVHVYIANNESTDKIGRSIDTYLNKLFKNGSMEDINDSIDDLLEGADSDLSYNQSTKANSVVVNGIVNSVMNHANSLPKEKRAQFLAQVGTKLSDKINSRARDLADVGSDQENFRNQKMSKEEKQSFTEASEALKMSRTYLNANTAKALVESYNTANPDKNYEYLKGLVQVYGQEGMGADALSVAKHHFKGRLNESNSNLVANELTDLVDEMNNRGLNNEARDLLKTVAKDFQAIGNKDGASENVSGAAIKVLAAIDKQLNRQEFKKPEFEKLREELTDSAKSIANQHADSAYKNFRFTLVASPESNEALEATSSLILLKTYQGKFEDASKAGQDYVAKLLSRGKFSEALENDAIINGVLSGSDSPGANDALLTMIESNVKQFKDFIDKKPEKERAEDYRQLGYHLSSVIYRIQSKDGIAKSSRLNSLKTQQQDFENIANASYR